MDKKLKFGVIGAGGFADSRSIPAFQQAKQFSLEAVHSRSESKAAKLARKHKASKYYTDIDELVKDADIDVVYVATPVYLHEEHTIKALRQKKHVLCEKPMALDVASCRCMVDAAKEAGVQLGLHFHMRSHPGLQSIKRMIEAGNLGKVHMIRTQIHFLYPPNDTWRYKPEKGGGGVMMDVGSHCLDLLRFLGGEITQITSRMEKRMDGEADDTAIAIARYSDGKMGITENSFAIPNRENMLEIYGSKASIIGKRALGPFTDPEFRFISDSGEKIINIKWENLYTKNIKRFIDSILGKGDMPATGEDGLLNTKLLKAAYRSNNNDKTIRIDS
ncbi:1,5-anhydro-D-fructose reductase (1,5-anhydro-D-mannitol-forming) [Fodinibius roseus]|uniref:1,5-anhydro-D-fructose reductase (1,5-anhydro-D-mannitol-forming) n=1 Tax=Fodinibius roseus TaxID=1194090 RepID=A0A1M5KZL7_9BACT|nr:Gfo/Idh/MocA family oxidoreductase [Fodinibius roseus]SHG58186.1 1,5-anhydro-D-fructose reductase (1,5-anhydro-D-mannitol-forming) [Fodinibius roseus]